MLCNEYRVRKGPELAQVGFDPATLTVKFLLTNIALKDAGNVILHKALYLLSYEHDKPL